MTPPVQPAAAGIHRYREFDRPPERDPERGLASVTDREDIPSTREMPDEARESPRQIVRAPSRPSPAGQRPARGPWAAEVLEDGLRLLNLPPRPSRRKQGQLSGVPLPPPATKLFQGVAVRSQALSGGCSAHDAGGVEPRSVGTGPCFCRAFLLMLCVSLADPGDRRRWSESKDHIGRPHQH
jgi:hypothetical protein